MIKEQLLTLVNELNRLDQTSDTLVKINWKTRTIVMSQSLDHNIISSRFWILLKNEKDKGDTYFILSKNKLQSVRHHLIGVCNNFENSQIVPEKLGFRIIEYSELLYKNNLTNMWVTTAKFSFRTSFLVRLFVWITSREYRLLKKNLKSTTFE